MAESSVTAARSPRPAAIIAATAVILLIALSVFFWRTQTTSAVDLVWTTANELDVTGWNIFRALTPDGPYTRVNERPLPPAADPLLGATHRFVDQDVRAGATYYYTLQPIDRSGVPQPTSEPIVIVVP